MLLNFSVSLELAYILIIISSKGTFFKIHVVTHMQIELLVSNIVKVHTAALYCARTTKIGLWLATDIFHLSKVLNTTY